MDLDNLEIEEKETDEEKTLFGNLYILKLIDNALNEKLIDGTKVNQENLDKFNKAILLVYKIFGKNKNTKIEIEEPKNTRDFASVSVNSDDFEISDKNKNDFLELVATVDYINVLSTCNDTFNIYFDVSNIWEE